MLDSQAQAIPYVWNEIKIAFFIYESLYIFLFPFDLISDLSSEMGSVGQWRLRFEINDCDFELQDELSSSMTSWTFVHFLPKNPFVTDSLYSPHTSRIFSYAE